MRKTIRAVAILAAAVVGITVAATAPAQAQSAQGMWSQINVPTQTYYPSNDGCVDIPVTVDLGVDMYDGNYPGGSWDVEIDVIGITMPDAIGSFDYGSQAIDNGEAVQELSSFMCLWSDGIGQYEATATSTVYDADYNEVATDTATVRFWIGARGTLSLNAGPEPVKKGKTLTVAGYFKLAHGYGDGLPNRTIHVWRALPGSSHWYEVATDKTDSKGRYVVTLKATKTYKWKATYEPTATQAHLLAPKTSASDSVKVK